MCRTWLLILPLLLASVSGLVSCINDNSQCIEDRPGYVEGRDVWFSFDISATGTAAEPQEVLRSRADDKDSHPSEAATVPENAVNPSDVILMLLDNNRNVTRVFDSSDYVVLPSGEANGSVYTLKIKVNIAYFDYAPGEDIPASLLIVANHNGTKSGETDMPVSGLLYRSATEISQQYYSFGFELKNNPSGWIPAPDKDMYIPMAGLKHFTLSRSALEASTADKP